MKPYTQLALAMLLAFGAAIGGALVGRSWIAPARPTESELHRVLHEQLALAPDQQSKIETIEQQFAIRRQALELELRSDNARLAEAIEAEHGYGPQVSAAVDHSHQAMGELQKATLEHIFAMRSVLHADQAAKFDAAIVKALTAREAVMIDLAACEDGELTALALAGRQAAYGELLHRHRAHVFRIARHRCGDDDTALEITQQSFIAAFAALRRYDSTRSFPHWIARITINKCHDWARRQQVRRFLGFAKPLEEAHEISDPGATPEIQTIDRQELRRTMTAIARLPAKLQEVLVLRTIEGSSQAETAQLLGVSEKAVETRLHRAREKLAALLRG